MTTVVEALQNATDALNGATAAFNARSDQVAAQLAAKATQAQSAIDTFTARTVVGVFVDPLNGNDAANGQTPGTPKRDLDAVLDAIGTAATAIYLLADAQVRRRRNVYGSLSIYGVQLAAVSPGYILYNRSVTLLGTAENSPLPGIGSFPAGLWLQNTNVLLDHLNVFMADQPANQNVVSHLTSEFGTNIIVQNGTIIGASPAAGSLVGSHTNPISVYVSASLGANAPGHLFEGIGAGSNPNNFYAYKTNITAA